MAWLTIHGGCTTGPCPKLKLNTETWDALAQGYETDLVAPDGEAIVHIPSGDFRAILRRLPVEMLHEALLGGP